MIISRRLPPPRHLLAGAGIFVFAFVAAPADAAGLFWSGRESADWSNPRNWNSHVPATPDAAPQHLNFDRHSAKVFAPNLDTGLTAVSLRFHGGDFTLGSSANKKLSLLLNSTVDANATIMNITGGNTINHDVALVGGINNARAVYVDSGTLRFGAGATLDFSGISKSGGGVQATRIHVAGGGSFIADGRLAASGTPDVGTTVTILKTGAGAWIINNDNNDLRLVTNVRVQEGDLQVNVPNGLRNTSIGCSGDGHRAIYINTPGGTLAASFNFIAGGSNSSLTIGTQLASGTVSFTGAMALSAAGIADADSRATRFAAPEGATVVVSGAIGDSHATNANRQGGIDKTGGGALILTGNNTYTQGTTVSSGTVFFNNAASSSGTGAVIVKEGAAIAGTGRINGTVVITGGTAAAIAPGNGDPAATALADTRLTLAALDIGAGVRIRLNSSPNFQVLVNGALTASSDTRIIFDFAGTLPATGTLCVPVKCTSMSAVLALENLEAVGLPSNRMVTFSFDGPRERIRFILSEIPAP